MTRRLAPALLLACLALAGCGEDDDSSWTGPTRAEVADELGCEGFEAIRPGSEEGDIFLCFLGTGNVRVSVFERDGADDDYIETMRELGYSAHARGDGWVAMPTE